MRDFARYRRAYRGLWASMGDALGDRHAWNFAAVGKHSSTEFTEADWQAVVARLQQLAGRPGVRDGKPHLRRRGIKRDDYPNPLDGGATVAQVDYLRSLAADIEWRHSAGPEAGLRALVAQRAFPTADAARAEMFARYGEIDALPRHVVSQAIRILERMAGAPHTPETRNP